MNILSILKSLNIGILVVDSYNRILMWNKFMERYSDIRAEELIGKNLFDSFDYLPKFWMELKLKSVRLIRNYSFTSWKQKPYLFQFMHNRYITDKISEFMYQDTTFIPITDDITGEVFVCIIIQDMTDIAFMQKELNELKDINNTLEVLSSFDALTSIYNRTFVLKQLEMEFNKSKRSNKLFSIILFDLDFFKKVNDTYGHLAGDEVLRRTSDIIRNSLRTSDVFGRYGGEEFIMVVPDSSVKSAHILANRIRKSIEANTIIFEEHKINITISLGIAEFRSCHTDYLQMIHEADIALYHSKKCGRNKVSWFMLSGCEAQQ